MEMMVIWEMVPTKGISVGTETAPEVEDENNLEGVEQEASIRMLSTYQEVASYLKTHDCKSLLILCPEAEWKKEYDLRPFLASTSVYLCTGVDTRAKLAIHLLIYLILNSGQQAAPFLPYGLVPASPTSVVSTTQIDWDLSLRYIYEHLPDSQLCLEDLAKQNYVCKWHFSKLFKKKFGLPFREFVIQQRIEQAKQLLLRTKSVSDVCYMVGYGDLTHFGRIFRQRVGLTPREYQNQHHGAVNKTEQ